jgi:hypothetical protein
MGGHEKPAPVMVGKNGIRLPQNYGLSYMDYIDMTKWYVQIPLDDIYILLLLSLLLLLLLYYIILYFIILYHIILYHIILYHIILYHIVLYIDGL